MFNFSANHMVWLDSNDYSKARVSILKDLDTHRCYRVYDYQKSFVFNPGKVYCVFGKINSADKLYLILEQAKEDTRYSIVKGQVIRGS
jgi:hypothetical protein